MTKRFVAPLVTVMCLALLALPISRVQADGDDTITVTVTIESVSVSITAGDPWALGAMSAGATSAAQPCEATNDGNVNEDFTIRVGNSSPANWAPGGAADANVFVMTLDGGTPLSGTDAALASDVAPAAARNFTLTFTAPTGTSDYTQQTITVTVTAAAS